MPNPQNTAPRPDRMTMFDTPEDKAVRHAYALLGGEKVNGSELSFDQRKLLRVLVECRGLANATPIRQLAKLLGSDPRSLKSAVHDLRQVFGVRIGSSRDDDGGFYLITTAAEAIDTALPLWSQAQSMMRVVQAILEPHELRELEGRVRRAQEGGR